MNEFNYKIIRADEIPDPGRITAQVMRYLKDSALVIADVTGANPNVYYELAIRHALGLPIIVCAEKGTVLPFDTRDNRTIFYRLHCREVEEACGQLDSQVRAINNKDFRPDNPFAEARLLLDLAQSSDPVARSLAQLVESVAAIARRLGAIEQRQFRPQEVVSVISRDANTGAISIHDKFSPLPPLSGIGDIVRQHYFPSSTLVDPILARPPHEGDTE
jgi:hypothetical protein